MKAKKENLKRSDIVGNNDLSNREILTAALRSWLRKLSYYSMFTAFPAMLTALAQEAKAGDMKNPEKDSAKRVAGVLEKLNKNSLKRQSLLLRNNYLVSGQESKSNIFSKFAGGDDCPGTQIPPGTYTAAAPYIDTGDITGANDTVSNHNCYFSYYGAQSSPGPDQIYTFTLTARGANPQIEITATSDTYNPQIYILGGSDQSSCPPRTGNRANNCLAWAEFSQSLRTETIGRGEMNGLPLNVPLYLFVDSFSPLLEGVARPFTLRIQDVTIGARTTPRTRFDFDGDGRADISVFRPSDRGWYLNRSLQGFTAFQFGLSTDKIVPADYDGDGRTDIAVFRDGIWYLLRSSAGFTAIHFGLAADIPVPADFTGDGRAELAVFRNGTWYTLNLTNNQSQAVQFGLSTDKPVVADYDGDNRADYAVYRNGIWYVLQSTEGFKAIAFGLATDKPVPADYDGDNKTDVAVYRDGIWYVLRSQAGFAAFQFGSAISIPVPADYDGDNKADIAVYQDGIWYLLLSRNGSAGVYFGLSSDKPIPSAYIP